MKQESLQLTGGNFKGDRRELDFYPTPPEVTQALCDFLNDYCVLESGRQVWEPACGGMDMAKVLSDNGYAVNATDIQQGVDFLNQKTAYGHYDAIITNPPFDASESFIRHALSLSPVVCMLLKSQYWHAAKRIKLFKQHVPSYVLPLTWRPDFLFKERINAGKKGAPTMEVAWTVWRTSEDYRNCLTQYIPLEKPQRGELFKKHS